MNLSRAADPRYGSGGSDGAPLAAGRAEGTRLRHDAPRPSADDEFQDPRNALLPAFEAMVEGMLANGLEAQVRTILARLLPDPRAVAQYQPRGDLELRALSGAQILRRLAKTRKSAAGRGELNAIASLLAEISKGDEANV